MAKLLKSLVYVLVVGILPATGAAQPVVRPDFSGTWVKHVKTPKPGALREVVLVTQDASGMRVRFSVEGRTESESVRYEFGRNAVQESPVPSIQAVITTTWQGETLKASTQVTSRSGVRNFDHLWSLDRDGELTIATVTPATADAPIRSTVSVYRRK